MRAERCPECDADRPRHYANCVVGRAVELLANDVLYAAPIDLSNYENRVAVPALPLHIRVRDDLDDIMDANQDFFGPAL